MRKRKRKLKTERLKLVIVLLPIFLVLLVVSYALILNQKQGFVNELIPLGATDAQIVAFIETYQNEQYVKRGKYSQLLETLVPVEGAEELPFAVKSALPSNIEVIPYDGPQGKGFQVNWLAATTTTDSMGTVRVEREVIKSVGFGPEASHRTWQR